MKNVMRIVYRKTVTMMEEIVNAPLVALISCLRILSVKRHAIIKTATLMEDIVFNVSLVAIKP